MTAKYYDNSQISEYRTCARKYYFRYKRGFTRDGREATPLSFGSSWHAAMDIVWSLTGRKPDDAVHKLAYDKFLETWVDQCGQIPPSEMSPEDETWYSPRLPMFGSEMIYNYIKHRKVYIENCSIVAIEPPFAVPVSTLDPDLFYIGRLDKVVETNGRISVIEHKTTTMYQGRAPDHIFKYNYIDGWGLNSQVDGYLHAAHMMWGNKVKNIMVDASLVHKNNHNLFKFIPIERATSQLDAFIYDTNAWVDKIERDKHALNFYRISQTNQSDKPCADSDVIATDKGGSAVMPAFAKNCNSCFTYNSKCAYFDLCRFWDNPEHKKTPDGMKIEFWEPFDTLKIAEIAGHGGD